MLLNLADRTPHWFYFLTFSHGRGWWWDGPKWIRTFDALSAAASPASDVQELIVYWWDGSSWARAFT